MPRHHIHFKDPQQAYVASLRVPSSSVTAMKGGGYCLLFESGHMLSDKEKQAITAHLEVMEAYWNIGYYQHSFEFAYPSQAVEAVAKLPPCLGHDLDGKMMSFYTLLPLDGTTQTALFTRIYPRNYDLDQYVDSVFDKGSGDDK